MSKYDDADLPPPLPAVEPAVAKGELNARARGWLKHLYIKCTTDDDWSSEGTPHELRAWKLLLLRERLLFFAPLRLSGGPRGWREGDRLDLSRLVRLRSGLSEEPHRR